MGLFNWFKKKKASAPPVPAPPQPTVTPVVVTEESNLSADKHIIIAGQSNALGFLNEDPAPYMPTNRVQIWALQPNGTYAWNYMLPGCNCGTANYPKAWGPEVQIAKRWLADNPSGVLWICKEVKGSTPLAAGAGVDWSPASAGEEFDIAEAKVDAARAALDGGAYAFSSWDVLFWMQGETDATDAVKAAAYGANIRDFITNARADWNFYSMVVGRISASPVMPYSVDVRNAQWNLDNGDSPVQGVLTFKTNEFPRQPDDLHYNAVGHYMLGNAFYDKWTL